MATTRWLIDPAHSEIQFKVKHLMITTVTGYLKQFDLVVETEEDDFTKASKIEFTGEIESIDSNNAQRDQHLRSNDFFAADKYPQIVFRGTSFRRADENYVLEGELTIRDITKKIMIDVEYAGKVIDPYGQVKAGFTIDTKIRRKDFDLTWDAVTEAGQVVVSNDIRVHGEIQLVRQSAEAMTEESMTVEAEA